MKNKEEELTENLKLNFVLTNLLSFSLLFLQPPTTSFSAEWCELIREQKVYHATLLENSVLREKVKMKKETKYLWTLTMMRSDSINFTEKSHFTFKSSISFIISCYLTVHYRTFYCLHSEQALSYVLWGASCSWVMGSHDSLK
mgnify:FL=1